MSLKVQFIYLPANCVGLYTSPTYQLEMNIPPIGHNWPCSSALMRNSLISLDLQMHPNMSFCWFLETACRRTKDQPWAAMRDAAAGFLSKSVSLLQLFQALSRPSTCSSQLMVHVVSCQGWHSDPAVFCLYTWKELSRQCGWRASPATSLRARLHEKMSCYFSAHGNTKVSIIVTSCCSIYVPILAAQRGKPREEGFVKGFESFQSFCAWMPPV